jgi:hypothetical protein
MDVPAFGSNAVNDSFLAPDARNESFTASEATCVRLWTMASPEASRAGLSVFPAAR